MSRESIGVLEREILRWNHQISLVSRVDAATVVSEQVDQCRRAWSLLDGHLGADGRGAGCCWVDVGSGSGLPGLVWAALRQSSGCGGSTLLVEPRDKRAWFLNRAARAMGLDRLGVMACRWGESPAPGAVVGDVERVVVSFKALRMTDDEVLAGIEGDPGLMGAGCVVVVRFMPPGSVDVAALAGEFGGDEVEGSRVWRAPECCVLTGDQLCLFVARYERG